MSLLEVEVPSESADAAPHRITLSLTPQMVLDINMNAASANPSAIVAIARPPTSPRGR
jgi:hypothetical protein